MHWSAPISQMPTSPSSLFISLISHFHVRRLIVQKTKRNEIFRNIGLAGVYMIGWRRKGNIKDPVRIIPGRKWREPWRRWGQWWWKERVEVGWERCQRVGKRGRSSHFKAAGIFGPGRSRHLVYYVQRQQSSERLHACSRSSCISEFCWQDLVTIELPLVL